MTRKITPAQLDEIEEAAKEERRSEWRWPKFDDLEQVNGHVGAHSRHIAMMDPSTTLALVAEVRELRAKVERVREVHQLLAMHQPARLNFCSHCLDDEFGRPMPADWPCDTIKALKEEA